MLDNSISLRLIPAGLITGAKIAGNTIANGNIAPLAISVDKIQDNAISAIKIADGSVTSGKLADLAVVASKVGFSLSGGNMVPNSSFEVDSDSDGWPDYWSVYLTNTPKAGSPALSTNAFNGNKSFTFLSDGTTASPRVILSSGRPFVPTNQKAIVTAYINAPNGISITLQAKGFAAASGGSETYQYGNTTTTATGTWLRVRLDITGNATGNYVGVVVGMANTPALDTRIYIDCVQLEYGDLPSSWAPKADEILPGTVGSTELAANSVIAAKIAAGAVVAGKIAADAVTSNEIAANSVIAGKIAANAVVAGSIAADAVTTNTIAANAITATKIAADAIAANNIQAGAVTAGKLAANSVTAGNIAANAVTAGAIVAGAVTANELAANAVTAGKIATNAVAAANVQAGSINASKLAIYPGATLRASVGGSYATVNDDLSLSLPSSGVNSTDGRWLMDDTRQHQGSETPVLTFTMTGYGFAESRGIVFGIASPFATSGQAGILIWRTPSTSAVQFYAVDGVGVYPLIKTVNVSKALTTTPEALGVQWYNTMTSDNIRCRVYLDGVEVASLTAAEAATAARNSAMSGYAGVLLPNTSVKLVNIDLTGGSTTIIADGTISTAKVQADAIAAGKIAANAVGAREIAANSITAKQLTIVDFDNLWPNPDGSTLKKPSGWTGAADDAQFQWAAVVADSPSGYAHHLVSTGTEVDAAIILPVKPNDEFYVEATCRKVAGGTVAGMYYHWYDNTYPAGGAAFGGGTLFNAPDTTFTFESASVPAAPSNAAYLKIYFFAINATADFTRAYLRRKNVGNMIVDGAITANKIFTNAITSDKILAGAVVADKIYAGAITADKIATGAITADKIGANEITADKIIMASRGSALNDDPSFSDASAWHTYQGSFSIVQLNDGKAGLNALASTSLNTWVHAAKFIDVDRTKVYRIRCWARRTGPAADGTFYLAVVLLDANSTNISVDGAWWYYPFSTSTLPTDGSWQEFIAVFGNGQTRQFPSNGVRMSPGVILNYTGSVVGMQVQDLRVEEVIPASLIVDGTITGDKVAANSITATNLILANFDNLVPNPTSEQRGGQWPAGSIEASGLVSGGVGYDGSDKARWVSTSGTATLPVTGWIPVAVGDKFYFEAMRKCSDASSDGYISLDYYSSEGSGWVAGTASSPVGAGAGYTSYHNVSLSSTVPSGARFARAHIQCLAGGVWFDNLYLRRKSDANLIVDGSITADKLYAGGITTEQLTVTSFENSWPNGNSEIAPPPGVTYTAWNGATAESLILGGEFGLWYDGGTGSNYGHSGNKCRVIHIYVANNRNLNHYIHVQPGEIYTFSAWFCPITLSGGGARLEAVFMDAQGGYLSTTQSNSGQWVVSTLVSTTGSWQQRTLTLTAPPGAVKLRAALCYYGANGEECKVDDIILKRMSDGTLIVDGSIIADKIAAGAISTKLATGDVIKTSNFDANWTYASGSGDDKIYPERTAGYYAAAGAQMSNGSTPMYVGPGGMRIGRWLVDEIAVRSGTGIEKPAGQSYVFYRGNSTGAPLIYDATNGDRIGIIQWSGDRPGTSTSFFSWDLQLQPKVITDNLDALRYLEIEIWSSTTVKRDTIFVPIPDRAYGSTSIASSLNYSRVRIDWQFFQTSTQLGHAIPGNFSGYLRIKAWNAYGYSATRDFQSTATIGGAMTAGAYTLGGSSGGGSGGGVGDCPTPDCLILMADGTQKRAIDLVVGDLILGRDDIDPAHTDNRPYPVTDVRLSRNNTLTLQLVSGSSERYSYNHRFLVGDQWKPLVSLKPDDLIVTPYGHETVKAVKPGRANDVVVKITTGCSTYFAGAGRTLQHNVKPS